MNKRVLFCSALAGLAAGTVNGIFGAAGGMVLIPALQLLCRVEEEKLFPMSVCVMLPVCLTSLFLSRPDSGLPWAEAFPWLLGSAAGGVLAGILGSRIPVKWLHRALGAMILWGGVRYLC